MEKAYYPICLDVSGQTCVVVGGGEVAERKTESLLECQARVRLVSPSITPALRNLVAKGTIEYWAQTFDPECLQGAVLVIAATNDCRINEQISIEGRKRGLLVNVVDRPECCTFLVPAVVRRGPLVISVSTGGSSPLLAQQICKEIEKIYGAEYARIVSSFGVLRRRLKNSLEDPESRRAVMRKLLAEGIIDVIREGREDQVEERVKACISSLSV